MQGVGIKTIISTCQPEPFVIVVGDHHSAEQAFLVCENKVVCEISLKDIPIYLVAIYYVFNMCYPKGCTNFYAFLELAVFKLPVKVSASVVSLHSRLDAL